MTKINFELNGKKVNAPVEWSSIDVNLDYINDSIQPAISVSELNFILTEAEAIKEWITNGWIFQGMPFKITIQDRSNLYDFDGYLNLTDDVTLNYDTARITAKLLPKQDLNKFFESLESHTYGFLEEEKAYIGKQHYTDLNFVIQERNNVIALIMIQAITFMLIKEAVEMTKETIKETANASTKTPGANVVYAIVYWVLYGIYVSAMIINIINLLNTTYKALVPITRRAKTMKLKTALEIVCNYFGYKLETNIVDLDDIVYLPSNFTSDSYDGLGMIEKASAPKKGIPNSGDYGYRCSEMFELCKTLFNGKYSLRGDTVLFYNVNDPIWYKGSTYKQPSILRRKKKFNTNELKANTLVSFDTDQSDIWTIVNFKGTNYEVMVDSIQNIPQEQKYIKGLRNIKIPICLGSEKTKLTFVEKALKALAAPSDALLKFFGSPISYADKIQNKVGMLRVGDVNYLKPKLVRLSSRNRGLLSAKYIYDNYYASDSFVSNNFNGQKEIFPDVEVPFDLNNLIELTNNSYFTTMDDEIGKVTSLKWNIASKTATMDYHVRNVYCTGLKESFAEPGDIDV